MFTTVHTRFSTLLPIEEQGVTNDLKTLCKQFGSRTGKSNLHNLLIILSLMNLKLVGDTKTIIKMFDLNEGEQMMLYKNLLVKNSDMDNPNDLDEKML